MDSDLFFHENQDEITCEYVQKITEYAERAIDDPCLSDVFEDDLAANDSDTERQNFLSAVSSMCRTADSDQDLGFEKPKYEHVENARPRKLSGMNRRRRFFEPFVKIYFEGLF